LGIAEEAFVVGHVGRFHEQKNHAFLVDVVQAAVALSPRVHCLLIGDGPRREEVTAEIQSRGLRDHFTFVPDTPAVSDYMTNVMDCFVFPSRYEGLGLVVVEAQAAGLPCLISDRIPLEAIVDTSLVRVLPLERSPVEWAKAALDLQSSRGESHALTALSRVENSHFNLDRCISRLQARYVQLAESN
jgi:glycosyltransferase involved in cell wall biosynthesis